MDIESRIRSRIESILVNDERNHAELKAMACQDEPFDDDPFEEERNLYQRIINSYRSAVNEVNGLLEENVGFLSGFYRIIEGIKSRRDFQEICSVIVDCVLSDFGAEYCSIILYESRPSGQARFCLEGVQEDRKFVYCHSSESLLGNADFEAEVAKLVADSPRILNIPDVYREPRFNTIDFPGVVRSLTSLPITGNGAVLGALLLSHSLPRYFNDNHIRVLRILAGMIAHLRMLAFNPGEAPAAPPPGDPAVMQEDVVSVVVLQFEAADTGTRAAAFGPEFLGAARSGLAAGTGPGESLLVYDEESLLLLLPGTGAEALPARVRHLREIYQAWRAGQSVGFQSIRMNVGYSTCDKGEGLSKTLEIAALAMRPDLDD